GRGWQGAEPDGRPRAQRDQATRLRDRQRQGGIRIGEVLRFAAVLRLDEELGLEEVRLLGRFREEQLLRERIIEELLHERTEAERGGRRIEIRRDASVRRLREPRDLREGV